MNVQNVSYVTTFVDAGLDESEVPLSTPVPAEEETKEWKNNDPEKYTHDNANNSTLGDSGARRWAVKGVIGDRRTHQERKVLTSTSLKRRWC